MLHRLRRPVSPRLCYPILFGLLMFSLVLLLFTNMMVSFRNEKAVAQTRADHGGSGVEITPTHIITQHDKVPRLCSPATITSVANGNWSNPDTWSTGRIPSADDRVQIDHNTLVTYDVANDIRINCIEIQGHLHFQTSKNTRLLVGTIFVLPTGVLMAGEEREPISSSVTAEIIFTDTSLDIGTIENPSRDPQQYGNGLLAWGTVSLHGAKKEPTFVKVAKEPLAGDAVIQLAQAPVGWKNGDTVIIPGTKQIPFRRDLKFTSEAELRTVAAVSGNTLTLTQPLQYDHRGARDPDGTPTVHPNGRPLLPHVGNLTRNIRLRSEDPAKVPTRGHVWTTHRAGVDLRYASFEGLGRTRAIIIDNTTFDTAGKVTHIGTNQIARYPIHTHHLLGPENPSRTGFQFRIIGNVVDGQEVAAAPKWQVTIHSSSFGLIQGNILYDGGGALLATEIGNEVKNIIERNFLIHTRAGEQESVLQQARLGQGFKNSSQYGAIKDGFWFTAQQHNYVRDNVIANVPINAVDYNGYYTNGPFLIPPYPGADPKDYVAASDLPVLESARNEIYGQTGIGLWQTWSRACCKLYKDVSLFRDYLIWHISHSGVYTFHENNNTYSGFLMRDDPAVSAQSEKFPDRATIGMLFGTNYGNGGIVINDVDIQGFNVGIELPGAPRDGTFVKGAVLRNAVNIINNQPSSAGTATAEIGDVRLRSLPMAVVGLPQESANIWMRDRRSSKPARTFLFNFNGNPGRNFQIFFADQAPQTIIPINPKPDKKIDLLDICASGGLTNQQCWKHHQTALVGGVAPCLEKDDDVTCEAAKRRAADLGINGLAFPFISSSPPPAPSVPPQLTIFSPSADDIFFDQTLTVDYIVSGNLSNLGNSVHAHFKLDSQSEVIDFSNDGLHVFTNVPLGQHILQGWLARKDHSKVAGAEDVVSFTIEPTPPPAHPEPPPLPPPSLTPSPHTQQLRPQVAFTGLEVRDGMVTVRYLGDNMTLAQGVALQFDTDLPVTMTGFKGKRTFRNVAPGPHRLTGQLIDGAGMNVVNADPAVVNFTVTAGLPQTLGLFDLRKYGLARRGGSFSQASGDWSGITYNPRTRTLFAVDNQTQIIGETDLNGALLRLIKTSGLQDPEGITYVRPLSATTDLFATVDENKYLMHFLEIGPTTMRVSPHQTFVVDTVKSGVGDGLEGISYDLISDTFYFVEEAGTKRVLTVKVAPDGSVTRRVLFQAINLPAPSFGDLFVNGDLSPNIFLMGKKPSSNKPSMIFEVTPAGSIVSSLTLPIQWQLARTPEGLTFFGAARICGDGEPKSNGSFFCLWSSVNEPVFPVPPSPTPMPATPDSPPITPVPTLPSPTDSTAICLSLHLKNREREEKENHSIAATIEIRNQNTGEVKRTMATSDAKGKFTVIDAAVLTGIKRDPLTPYQITITPHGHLPTNILDTKNLFNDCKVMPATAVGDFNNDGRLTISDFTRLIKFYLTGNDPELEEYYGSKKAKFVSLIDFIREMRQ